MNLEVIIALQAAILCAICVFVVSRKSRRQWRWHGGGLLTPSPHPHYDFMFRLLQNEGKQNIRQQLFVNLFVAGSHVELNIQF